LLPNKNWRRALADEVEPRGPKVALVFDAFAFARDREGLARA
jgi:hypothetical protein